MKIEAGKFYRTRDGKKVGPLRRTNNAFWPTPYGSTYYRIDGTSCEGSMRVVNSGNDIVAEWTEGPVRTIARREIVPGTYGDILVDRTDNDGSLVLLGFKSCGGIFPQVRSRFSSAELTAAIATLTAIRDALDEVA